MPDEILETSAEIGKRSMRQALARFGWTDSDDFWRQYYTDPRVFHLANAVERLGAENDRLRAALETIAEGDSDWKPMTEHLARDTARRTLRGG